jgi:hypothetical protein
MKAMKGKISPHLMRKNWKVPYAALLICIVALPFILVVKSKMERSAASQLLEWTIENEPGEGPFDHFRLTGVSLVRRDDAQRKLFSVEAEKIIHRNRRARFFLYYNLKEIYISNLKVGFYPRQQPDREKSRLLSRSFEDISDQLLSTLGFPALSENHSGEVSEKQAEVLETPGFPSLPENHSKRQETEADILTRVVIEKLSLMINCQEGRQVLLSSEMAFINLRGATFEEYFSLTSTDGKNLSAPTAIWLKDSESIYFPHGYSLQFNGISQEGTEAVFTLDGDGRLSQSDEQFPEQTSGLDSLDEAELVVDNFFLREAMQYLSSVEGIPPWFFASLLPASPSVDPFVSSTTEGVWVANLPESHPHRE